MIKKITTTGTILLNKELVKNHYHLRISVSDGFPLPEPGQFAMLRLKDRLDPLLGRPFCVYDYDHKDRILSFIYRVVGAGTGLLSQLREGDPLEILGPLGRPFDVVAQAKMIVFIAGGMGAVALYFLARHYAFLKGRNRRLVCYLGAKNAGELVGLSGFEAICSTVKLTTEDASAGRPGMITDLVAEDLAGLVKAGGIFYACGPRGMLKNLAERFSAQTEVFCQVTLEERMACGLGACLGCAVAVESVKGDVSYRQVCCDGPVFDIRGIDWRL